MKTIKRKGKVYQVGTVYEFSDNKRHWYIDTLEDIHQEDAFPYKANGVITSLSGFVKLFVNKCLTIKSISIKLHTTTTKERKQHENN